MAIELQQVIADVREHAPEALTRAQARLFAQSLRLRLGQTGFASFTLDELDRNLGEASLLVDTALVARAKSDSTEWRSLLKRAAAIYEWLSQSGIRPADAPLELMSAASYQLAGYPAMALGVLRHGPASERVSSTLWHFLKADFPSAQKAALSYWSKRHEISEEQPAEARLSLLASDTIIRAVSVLCAYLRWEESEQLPAALNRLTKVCRLYAGSDDNYSSALADLLRSNADEYISCSYWKWLGDFASGSEAMSEALSRFCKAAFVNRRALAWPAQIEGIKRLSEERSFAICTPTGSGKTTIAELAIIRALFASPDFDSVDDLLPPLVLYLVPKRMLAAEVEERLSQDLSGLTSTPVVVTGLYGGTDWGPTDVWLSADHPTVLVSTYEKAEALMRFLGALFLSRLRGVVIDEAHNVNLEPSQRSRLGTGDTRSLRLESLGTRLRHAQQTYRFDIVALSAVAGASELPLARWVSGTEAATSITHTERTTRQLIGRLVCLPNRRARIEFDLMDSRPLEFSETETSTGRPYVNNPFPQVPDNRFSDPQKPNKFVLPFVAWGAMNVVASEGTDHIPDNRVLIYLTQAVDSVLDDLLALLYEDWVEFDLPPYFADAATLLQNQVWLDCRAAMEDLLSTESPEFKLFEKGIVVHRGNLPPLLSRHLRRVIEANLVRIIVATSTVAEGVNLPVTHVILPFLNFYGGRLSTEDFCNLAGRAGRPGFGTEGQVLVAAKPLRDPKYPPRALAMYREILSDILAASTADSVEDDQSPLAELIRALRRAWQTLTGSENTREFESWLESTVVIGAEKNAATDHLEVLDELLIASVQEIYTVTGAELAPADLEEELRRIWRCSYAAVAAAEENVLERTWIARGRAIPRVYGDAAQRQRLYRTGLPPRSADELLSRIEALREAFEEGRGYAGKSKPEQFATIKNIVGALGEIEKFALPRLGSQRSSVVWDTILQWWLYPEEAAQRPEPKAINNWFRYIWRHFSYKIAWAMGSVTATMLFEGSKDGEIGVLEVDDWPKSGLPWVAFWLKELLNWGTLDPVAVMLLSRGGIVTRSEAHEAAKKYYEEMPSDADPEELINPSRIRDWMRSRTPAAKTRAEPSVPTEVDVTLVRPALEFKHQRLRVMPADSRTPMRWVDVAGFHVATSTETPELQVENFDFWLDIQASKISIGRFL